MFPYDDGIPPETAYFPLRVHVSGPGVDPETVGPKVRVHPIYMIISAKPFVAKPPRSIFIGSPSEYSTLQNEMHNFWRPSRSALYCLSSPTTFGITLYAMVSPAECEKAGFAEEPGYEGENMRPKHVSWEVKFTSMACVRANLSIHEELQTTKKLMSSGGKVWEPEITINNPPSHPRSTSSSAI